jgi:predicted ArsR family transcriptional regulator
MTAAAGPREERRFVVLRDVERHPNSTAKAIAARAGVALPVAYRSLEQLVDEGLVKRSRSWPSTWAVKRGRVAPTRAPGSVTVSGDDLGLAVHMLRELADRGSAGALTGQLIDRLTAALEQPR